MIAANVSRVGSSKGDIMMANKAKQNADLTCALVFDVSTLHVFVSAVCSKSMIK